jgi:BirA family biotin operon repressor/biotin-[acetyl-CoA-carboxylase] ligase
MFQAENLDRLIADELQAHFACATIGRRIVVLEQTGSTNDAILQVANANATEGLVLFAEHQTAGRGQRGNRWESARGKGLWFSILLRPKIQINDSAQLTIWGIENISDAIRTEFSLQPTLKLPNDIQIHGRKVAGVLVEMRARPRARHAAVVGVGINVNQSLEDFPPELEGRAISLAMVLRKPVDRHKFAVAVLQNLDRSYRARFA